jgi:hypothetical protein
MRRNRKSATWEEFSAGGIPVREIITGYGPPPDTPAQAQQQHLVAVLDTAKDPRVNITDLARLHQMEGDSDTETAWDYWLGPPGYHARLIAAYTAPVALELCVVFDCERHWQFLRQVVEHDGAVDIADEQPGGAQESDLAEPRKHLRIFTTGEPVEDLTMFLQALSISRAQEKKGSGKLTDMEVIMAALDAKRFMSIVEARMFAETQIPIQTQGEQTLRVRILPKNEKAVIPNLSPAFKDLLLRLLDYEKVGMGLYKGEVHLLRMDWLFEPPAM